MSIITLGEFKQQVLNNVSGLLGRHGYMATIKNDPDDWSLVYTKQVSKSTWSEIGFQLLENHIPPMREFKVWLNRATSDDVKGNFEDLHIDMRNMVQGVYGINIFPKGTYYWKFVDHSSLREALLNAVSLVEQYGIPWLEDPKSNMDWLFHRE